MRIMQTLLTMLLWLSASSLQAMPMLSADGSFLSGVEYNGLIYDITLGDTRLDSVYTPEQVSQPGWSEFANGLDNAIAEALNSLPVFPSASDINGCEDDPVYGDFCFLVIPDSYNPATQRFGDARAVRVFSNKAALDPASALFRFDAGYDFENPSPSDPFRVAPIATLVSFSVAPVSAPSSVTLAITALIALTGMRRRNTKTLG